MGITPDMMDEEKAEGESGSGGGDMDDGQFCVSLENLKEADGKDEMVPPEEGDDVNFNVAGKIVRVEGTNAYVQPTEINGMPVKQPDAAAPDAGAGEDESQQPDMSNYGG